MKKFTFFFVALFMSLTAFAADITATWSIEEGATLESFTEATITFTGVEAATTTSMYPACFYKVAEDGTLALVENYCTAGVLDRTATGASIKLWVDEETGCYEGKITAGNYRIVLSAGMVKFNNDNSNKNTEEYVLNFSIAGSDEPALEEIDAVYTVNPENNANVTEIREIVLNFTGYETIAVAEPDMVNGSNIPTVYFEDELTGAMMPAGYIMFKADTASANGLRLYVDPAYTGGAESYVAEGKYAINIPAGVVTFSDGISKAITLNYTVKAEEVVEPTTPIVEGTKLYLKSYLGVASASSYEYKVVFGEFTVPSSGGGLKPGGGGLRPLAETATATEVAMTTVYTKEGKYNIWEVVAPAGTADSIFTIIISRRNAVQGYITPLKYDGVNNLFQLPDGFSFPRNTNVVNETAGEWGVYVEGVDPDPDPELVGNITAGLQFYFDFSANETWNALTGLKAKFTNSNGGTETVEMTQLADSTTWTVVVPEGLWQSFTVGTFKIMAPSINDLTYDGTNNLYTLDAEGNGTWSVYVEKTEPNVITVTWSIEEGAELESFAGVTVTFSGVDSIGRKLDGVEVLKAVAQGSSTNALFYSVAEDGTRTPVAGGNGLMYASSKTEDGVISINYSVANKGYTLENDSYTVPGNYCFVIDAGDVLFTPNRSGLPKVYNDQEYVLNFSIKGSVAVVEAIDAQYSVDPENNTELTEIREVVVTFSEYDSIIVKETVSEGVNWLVCETEVTTEQGAMWTTVAPMKWEAVEGTLNALRIYVAADMFGEEAVTIEGAYRIIIPEGVVYFSETPEVTTYNKAITLNYTIIEESLPMEVEFENIAAIYEMGMWDMAYYESYSNYEVVALLKSQPTVVDKVVTSGMMGGNMNNYYLNDGTGIIVLQAEGDRYEPITDENWDVIGWDTIPGLTIEVGKKLPVDFMANIDFKTVTDEETWLPTGEVYGAPVMTFVPKATGDVIVDEDGWETIVTESNEEFAARCEASDFVEEAVEANLDDVLANRIDYAGKLLVLDTTANYYAESNPYMGTMSAYMFWNAEEAFEVESYEEEGTTVVYVSPKYTEDNNNFAGKLFNVNGEELPEAAFDANVTIDVVKARFDWNSIAQGQTLVVKEYEVKVPGGPVDVENGELVVNIYSNNGSVYVETEAGAMIEVYTVNGLRVYAGVSNTNTTVINGLNTNIAIIRVNGETYKVFVK